MNYRTYNPDREIFEKQLRATYSEFLHAYETAMVEGVLSEEDKQIVKDIEDKLSNLRAKVRNSNQGESDET